MATTIEAEPARAAQQRATRRLQAEAISSHPLAWYDRLLIAWSVAAAATALAMIAARWPIAVL